MDVYFSNELDSWIDVLYAPNGCCSMHPSKMYTNKKTASNFHKTHLSLLETWDMHENLEHKVLQYSSKSDVNSMSSQGHKSMKCDFPVSNKISLNLCWWTVDTNIRMWICVKLKSKLHEICKLGSPTYIKFRILNGMAYAIANILLFDLRS